MRSVVFGVILVILVAEKSLALKCYICDSDTNAKCKDLSDPSIEPQKCTFETYNHKGPGQLGLLIKTDYQKLDGREPEYVCQKVVGWVGNGERTVVRRCQVKVHEDCHSTIEHSPAGKGKRHIKYCEFCHRDSCNSAPTLQAVTPILAIALAGTYISHCLLV